MKWYPYPTKNIYMKLKYKVTAQKIPWQQVSYYNTHICQGID